MSTLLYASDLAFTPTVKAIQARKGSRHAYARMEQGSGWQTTITPDLKAFIEAQTSVFLATANAEGQPYIQHRGGPAGFLQVLDAQTIALADFNGNRQFISTGNLAENAKAHLFLMDYAQRRRIKVWARARVIEGDAALLARLMPANYKARAEQVIVLTVITWDENCPQHIAQLLPAAAVHDALRAKDQQIDALALQVRQLEARLRDRAAAGP
jgi:uncharacterized protein